MNRQPSHFPINVGGSGWPAQMMQPDVWIWVLAISDYDWRDRRAFDSLMDSGKHVPECLLEAVETLTNGTRPQRTQSVVNRARITGADRLRVAAEISNRLGLLDANKFNAARIGETQREEPAEVLAKLKARRAEVFAEVRTALAFEAVNIEALEDCVRELRGLAQRWPRA